MSPEIKGAIVTLVVALICAVCRILWNRDKRQQVEIEKLKLEKQTSLESKIQQLDASLSANLLAAAEVKLKFEQLNSIVGVVDRLSKDINAFHVWKRLRFAEGRDNGESES